MDEEDLIDFAAQPRVEGLGGLRLPTFWVDKPASWFITAESRFWLHGINREQNRYDYLVAALSSPRRLSASSSTSWRIPLSIIRIRLSRSGY
jgi:hypothetical protein